MSAEEKLKAVQLWNVLSEKLQEIVNSSAADINALAFQETLPATAAPSFFFYPNSRNSETQEGHQEPFQSASCPIRETIEADNSLASFSDIQCADDESIHMDGVCPLTLPMSSEERSEQSFTAEVPEETGKEEKSKQFGCSVCGVSFRTKGHLLDHGRKHTGSQIPYSSPHKSFKSISKCSGERPFHCNQCGSTFTTGSNLKRHGNE